jgi:hypothetical protein
MLPRMLILMASGMLLNCPPLWAESTPADAIHQLLTTGWNTRPEGRAQAEEIYRQGVEDHPGDRQLVYAYALVRMQQRQYPEAAKLLEQYLAIEKQDAHAWRAKAWLSMLMKNAPASLVELDKLSQLLADEKSPISDADQVELTAFLGRMIGFLEGPGEGAVNMATLAQAKRKISERLTATQRENFDQQASAVTDEFSVLATAKDDAQVQEIVAAERQKRERRVELDKDEVNIAARKEELRLVSEKVNNEIQAENDAYARADQPLADALSSVSAQGALLERDLSRIVADIISLRAQATREMDPVRRDLLFREIDRLDIIAARLDADLLSLRRRAQALQGQRNTLAARHNQALAGYSATLATAQKEFQTLENRLKRAATERAKLGKPATGNTGKVIALNAQAVALSTYENFPLEAEKQRLLDLVLAP